MPYFVRLPKRIDDENSAADSEHYLNIINGNGTIVQRELRRKGFAGYELDTASVMCAVFHFLSRNCSLGEETVSDNKNSFSFFDVGANGGFYSSLCGSLYREESEVAAFEPTPDSYHWLEMISLANRLNVRTVNVALSSQCGSAEFFLSEKSDASNSLNPNFKAKHKGSISVPCTTLDTYIEESGCVPDFLKIDTETHEESVLKGAENLLRTHRPILVMEAIKKNGVDYGERVSKYLDKIGGYRYFHIGPQLSLTEHKTMLSLGISGNVDWLISPVEPSKEFLRVAQQYASSLSECTANHNIDCKQHKPTAEKPELNLPRHDTPTLKASVSAIGIRLREIISKYR